MSAKQPRIYYICDGYACSSNPENCFRLGGLCTHTDNQKHSLKRKLGRKFPPTRLIKILKEEAFIEEIDLTEFLTFFV